MDQKQRKLTTNADEAEISQMLSGDSVFEIPYFQRPYKWKPGRLRKLEEDILNIVDGQSDSHFLGAIIIHGKKSNPSDPKRFEVIDGQQRITTIFIYLCASIRILCRYGHHDEAAGLYQKYIAIGRKTTLLSNVRLHPSGEDRRQLNTVLSDLTADVILQDKIGPFKPVPLPNTGHEIGPLLSNYRSACRFMDSQVKQSGITRLQDIYTALLEFMSVVQIDIYDPASAPKIFDSLNSRQEPMTIGDLVRNDIFSRVADQDHLQVTLVDRDEWQPFYTRFQIEHRNHFEDYFFPFGLVHNPNVSKSDVFNDLRNRWKNFPTPSEVITDLSTYQRAFLDIICGTNTQAHPAALSKSFLRIRAYRAPASTYPFFMRLSEAARIGELDVGEAIKIVDLIEAFLVRRALVGIEPTGLHAVFKRLWSDCDGTVTVERVKAAIQSHSTVTWPTDLQVQTAVAARPVGDSIAAFFIREFDLASGGDTPDNIPWIEHVLPQTLSEEWKSDFSSEDHKNLVGLAANLIPLSSKMNIQVSNGGYASKRVAYGEDSMFKSARAFAETYSTWAPTDLANRSKSIAAWAVKRWPG